MGLGIWRNQSQDANPSQRHRRVVQREAPCCLSTSHLTSAGLRSWSFQPLASTLVPEKLPVHHRHESLSRRPHPNLGPASLTLCPLGSSLGHGGLQEW